uniref:Uncharacterized protein n=1 Tax=Hippocampus comes TaxID=109280 RepID=A0A3Q2Z7P5_HIPCM
MASSPEKSTMWSIIRRRRRARKERLLKYRRERKQRILRFLQQQVDDFVAFMTMWTVVMASPNVERTWMKTRSSVWWDRVVNGSFSHSDWIANFRMSKEAFRYVCEKLRPSLSRVTTTMRKPVSVEKRVAITLWKLATNACYRTIGHLFGVAKNTVCVIVHQTCSAIVSEMSQDLIKWPVGDLMNENVRKFEERWGFPQVLGGIDGTHIPIIRPHDCHTDYYNRKGFYSVIMQAVVDSSYRFIDIFIGWPGSVHDARVFANSPLYQNRTSGSLFWGDKRDIGGVPVPLVLLGDAAYPLSTWLMKPFSDNGRLTQPQKDFNYKHSRARMVVENAFGRLKGRWRQWRTLRASKAFSAGLNIRRKVNLLLCILCYFIIYILKLLFISYFCEHFLKNET